ncbi:MAG: TetR family transcriptional regulator [Desulfovibrio sp. MES5]|uniref:TetR/AcrR family transcriptional regulator n=1 Tax=Desulfovibrio sp. MES5 TaxID=1899016 RepID=UPI000B9CB1F8|nr:TetR/AcrR family transcriptional regulator [Desulfovibrio sp. MES5]OXS27887.1 MAG: TetR family transcriptional regulator [Desulfovibrio sp. MES5]
MKTITPAAEVRRHILETGQAIMSGKGFSAVGLTEILTAAGVPKGSFYYYFKSKDAFGEALLEQYFADYMAEITVLLEKPGQSGAERLIAYWEKWLGTQAGCDHQGKCLAVKLGAEVADLSEAMRNALRIGTARIMQRLAKAIDEARADGSLVVEGDALFLAETLYQLWIGASLLEKITRNGEPLKTAMVATRRILNLSLPK